MMTALIVWVCIVTYSVVGYFSYSFIEVKTYIDHELCAWLGVVWFISLPTIIIIAVVEHLIQKILRLFRDDTPEERF